MKPKVREAKRTSLIAVLISLIAVGIFTTDATAMYHPGMGRFMQRDPGAGGAVPMGRFIPRDPTGTNQYADGMSLYQYVQSAPTTYVDPSGKTVCITCKARSQVQSGLHSASVSGYDMKKSDSLDEYSGAKTQFRIDGSYSEIAGSMIRSKRVSTIKGNTAEYAVKNRKMHIDARKNIVTAAKSAAFAFSVHETWNQQHWRGRSTVPQATSTAYDAVTDIWAQPAKYEMGCLRATAAVLAEGIAKTSGKDEFNKAWGGPGASLTGLWGNRALTRWYYNVDEADWIPGDWGYVDDPRANPPAGQEGENTVYVGNKKYWGHPSQIKTLDQRRTGVGGWSGTAAKDIKVVTWRIAPALGFK